MSERNLFPVWKKEKPQESDENGMNELRLVDMIPKLDSLRDMSAGKNRFDLAEIGEKSAAKQVLDEHFPNEFNIE